MENIILCDKIILLTERGVKMSKKNSKRGIPIQTRTILSIIILLLEIIFIANSVINFAGKISWLHSLAGFLGIILVIHIITIRGNQSYKIMWIVFILLIPVFGVLAYLLFGGGRVFPHIKKRFNECNKKYLLAINSTDATQKLNYNDMLHYRQAAYLKNEGGFPIFDNTTSVFLPNGEAFFDEVLKVLKTAEKYIYIEFFILAEGYMWDEIFKILTEKSKTGVEIKIIFDDFGSIKRQNKNFVSKLKKSGIEVSIFNPIRPSIDIFMNNRNHRKIIIVDSKYAFTGGINIGDEYINKVERYGHWLDTGIKIEGKAVNAFLAMFCSMWEFTTKQEIDINSKLGIHKGNKDGFYIPYCDDPLDISNTAQGIYMQIIGTAQKFVYIETPYLILDSAMISALCLATKSGVDVRIITPHIPDKWYVHPVTQYYYSELLDSGVKIYEYTPGFIHSKVFVSDDSVATVGTVNMDYRSFNFHFECGVWCSGSRSVHEIKKNFLSTLENCEEIINEEWKKRPLLKKFKQTILHLFAPLM